MSKSVLTYKTVTHQIPATYQYTCDTCSHVFKKGERKVTYNGNRHACYDKPCSPFSHPKGYERVWNVKEQAYVWEKQA